MEVQICRQQGSQNNGFHDPVAVRSATDDKDASQDTNLHSTQYAAHNHA